MLLKLISVLLFFGTGAGLLWYMLRAGRAKQESKGALWAAFGFGAVGIFAAIWLEMFLPAQNATLSMSAGGIFLSTLAVGFIEEASKFLPLALFIYKKSYFNTHTDGVIYFVISGLTFGITEDLLYTFLYSSHYPAGNYIGLVRIFTGLFFHAASTGIAGYYLIRAKIHRQSLWVPAAAVGVLMLVHATYDFLLYYTSSVAAHGGTTTDGAVIVVLMCIIGALSISGILNLCLFLYYRRAKQWDYSVGLAVDPKQQAPQQQYTYPYWPQTVQAVQAAQGAPMSTPAAAPQPGYAYQSMQPAPHQAMGHMSQQK